MFKTKRKSFLKKKGGLLDFSLQGVLISITIMTILSIVAYALLNGNTKNVKLSTIVDEAVTMQTDVETFLSRAGKKGEGYVYFKDSSPLNPSNLQVYTGSQFKLNGTGASSYFCSNTNFGCKVKYYISTGAANETWSLFIDASKALSPYSTKQKETYELEIEKAFTESGLSPVVNHSATVVSAATTDVTASSSNDGDGVLEFGQL